VLLEWDRQLYRRRGAARRLAGLDIYYDFRWRNVFRHNRAIFPRGQSLSDLVRRDCPEGKLPTLLLTERDDVSASIHETADRYIVIVPIHDYLGNAGADAASTYYARLSARPLTQLASLADVNFSTSEFNSFLDEHLTQDALTSWASRSNGRMDLLRDISGDIEGPLPENVVNVIRRLTIADPRVLDEIVSYLDRFDGDAGLRSLVARLTESADGRAVAAHVLAERLSERISDTRGQLEGYQSLIASTDSNETAVQQFLELNPWIVGLPYVGARARIEIPRGEIDFVLDRYDGFFDIVELKGPDEAIVVERRQAAERPPSASAYTIGPALSRALAQAHHYRAILDQSRELSDQYGLADSRQPKILILIGRSTDLSNPSKEILRQLNLSLHRVEVIPYDLLGRRTEGLLDNIEALLAVPQSPNT
jgi:Domain of unknown function (DUF4263)